MHHEATAAAEAAQRTGRLPHLPGLDGLRALAVIAVLLYHAGIGVSGGFLGVESFFVLSGFLITALLLAEWRAHGRIDLGAFWMRRARRLLPALVLVLLGTLLLAALLPAGETRGLRGDILAALSYVMNWRLVLTEQSYFDATTRPSLLQHLWSLAIEEQFYLVWPLVFIGGMYLLRRWGMLVVVVLGACASLTLMAQLYEPGSDPSRIYYGTDTRVGAILIGAALALVWSPWRWAEKSGARSQESEDQNKEQRSWITEQGSRITHYFFELFGLLALLGLLIGYSVLNESHPWLYPGGFVIISLATMLVIMAVTHPQGQLLARLLELAPLRWIGERSYGIYLWHWPIFMVTRPQIDLPYEGWLVQTARIAAVIGMAALSYHCVEQPFRRHGFAALLRLRVVDLGAAELTLKRALRFAQTGAVVMAVAACGPIASVPATPEATDATPTAAATATLLLTETPLATATPEVTVTPENTATPEATVTPENTATPEATPTPSPTIEVALPAIDAGLAAELQRILDATVADGYIPGAVLAVTIPGYEPWTSASGLADRNTGAPITAETRVRIASISKIFTAVVILQMVEDGLIALDAPMEEYVPGLLANGNTITVRQLLQHTSGLYDYLEDRNYVPRAYEDPARVWEPSEMVSYAAQFPALFAPGAAGSWDYSSTNYVILGMIAEAASGRTLAVEMRERIFTPLELDATYFPQEEAVEGAYARGYARTQDQTGVALSWAFATANIVSTAGDVARFSEALHTGELLAPQTLEQMYGFVSGKGQYNMPELAYGLGLMRNRLPVRASIAPEQSVVYGHIGGFGGFRSATWYAPESGITIALAVNQASTDPNILATQILDAALAAQ
ncbi:serine hydrolase [Candidatus Gracilibacteria bacterium]|nr:serine hydrolase [Candidatus Gracilibacteria bacterium]